jgi:hypothetical protein
MKRVAPAVFAVVLSFAVAVIAQAPEIPEQYKFIITGRILDEAKLPMANMGVQTFQIPDASQKEGRFKLYLRKDEASGVFCFLANTDNSGKFKIVADRRYWNATGNVVLVASVFQNLTQYHRLLKGASGEPIVIVIDKDDKSKKGPLDLGDIIVNLAD